MKSSIGKVRLKYESTQAQRMNSHAPTSHTVKPKVISADLEISLIDTWAVSDDFQRPFTEYVSRSSKGPLWAGRGPLQPCLSTGRLGPEAAAFTKGEFC